MNRVAVTPQFVRLPQHPTWGSSAHLPASEPDADGAARALSLVSEQS